MMNQKGPGLGCPECGFNIQISIEMLLSANPIYCTGCGLKLQVDRKASHDALNSLKTLRKGLKEAENLKDDTTGSMKSFQTQKND